jgi:hypothetical protein
MITGAIEASRAWGAGLNRLGWGCICALMLLGGLGFGNLLASISVDASSDLGGTFIKGLALLLASGVFGSMAITAGSFNDLSGFDLKKRTRMAEHIGRLGNPLLIQFFNDANFRYEMAAGVRGTIYFGIVSFAFFAFSRIGETGVDYPGPSFNWKIVSGSVLAFVFDWLLGKSATDAFVALEDVIKESHHKQLEAAGGSAEPN